MTYLYPEPPLDPPEPRYEPDADEAYERYVQRVDDGDECPVCHATHGITRETALGIPLFVCGACSQRWFDVITTPTTEAS